jgi:3-hydroxyisobutyrate dehydrogenase
LNATRRVGFVGLGAMGAPMVTQLARDGVSVIAYDVDPGRAGALSDLPHVEPATSLADLAAAHLAICMLPSSAVVEEVVAGENGLLDVLPPGALIADMSSSDPKRTVELARTVSERGFELVDAPVSGGVRQASVGGLTVMFGGSEEQLERIRPVLQALASRIIRVGEVGAGHAMKCLNNVMSAAGLTVACEVIEVGRRFGLDPNVMLDVLNGSTGRNHATETKIAQYVLSESYDSGFLLRLMLKDLDTAADLARSVGVEMAVGEACLAFWNVAADALPPRADQTAIAILQRRQPPSTRL